MAQRAQIEVDEEGAGSSLLGRFLTWAGLAALALGGVVLAAQTRTGSERLAQIGENGVMLAARPTASLPRVARLPEPDAEPRRLAETVRALAADRDRLLARLETLERNLDTTGSIPQAQPKEEGPPQAAAPPVTGLLPPSWALMPGTILPAPAMPPVAIQSAPAQATESVATKTEFAVDLGGDPSLDGLRALWTSLKAGHAALFEGLRPVVAVREAGKPGALELRLVVGPLANAVAAARLCASLTANGLACQPTVFDGQRLALR
jgi:hypothetical protein